ncbi:hypothetical protein [Halobaculum litoreum]|uniref:DsrE/DsrF-like family protein n=1 Tax=Halobaculum litoreum TaxID=3031998 RepID=A0ABD5XLY6_9EURY|nr:hypothetical protein [Halobaculum sp. DT92]
MRTVFHVSTTDQLSYVDAKVTNLLADDSLTVTAVAVVVDNPAVIDAAAGGDGRERVETVLAAGGDDADTAVRVCANALRGATATLEDLPAGVERASSGVGELTRLQADGWSYIRP